MTRITPTRPINCPHGTPEWAVRSEYLRFFRDLTVEYLARSERLEARLLASGTCRSTPDTKFLNKPIWELPDVCCLTNVSLAELQEVVPAMLDAYRRLHRLRYAASAAPRVKRQDRLALASQGIEALLDGYGAASASCESEVDRWLTPMFEPCRRSASDHAGRSCRKAVPWTLADLGGGRSLAETQV